MHAPHIKPQNLGVPFGQQPRKAKPKSIEAELIAPVPEWERDGKRRNAAFPRNARPAVGDDDAPGDDDRAWKDAEDAGDQQAKASAAPAEDDELSRLLGAVSTRSPSVKPQPALPSEDVSLQDLLSRFANPASSGRGDR